jgi:hypothetical protein
VGQSLSRNTDDLKEDLKTAQAEYRATVKWACQVLDYKKSFEREEDFGEDELREHILFLRDDSRQELKTAAINVKRLKSRIKILQECLVDLARKR